MHNEASNSQSRPTPPHVEWIPEERSGWLTHLQGNRKLGVRIWFDYKISEGQVVVSPPKELSNWAGEGRTLREALENFGSNGLKIRRRLSRQPMLSLEESFLSKVLNMVFRPIDFERPL